MSDSKKRRRISVKAAQTAYMRGYEEGAYWRNESNPYTEDMWRFCWSMGHLDRRSINPTPRTIDQATLDGFYVTFDEVERKYSGEVPA